MKAFQKFTIVVLVMGLMFYLDSSVASPHRSVEIELDADTKGPIYLAVFDSEKGFPSEAKHAAQSSVLPKGTTKHRLNLDRNVGHRVALAAFVDVNGNGKLDSNGIGVPLEPVAFSTNPTLVFSAPSFKDSLLNFAKQETIQLKFKEF